MAAEVLQGVDLARDITRQVGETLGLFAEMGRPACLTTIVVGSDPGSEKYAAAQAKQGGELGVDMNCLHLPADISQDDLETELDLLGAQDKVDAVILQHPLPNGLDYLSAISCLDPQKDADGLHPANLGRLIYDPVPHSGRSGLFPELFPCTPKGIVELLRLAELDLRGRPVTVVGRGLTVGKPLALLLGAYNNGPGATVTVTDAGTHNPETYTRNADVVIGAAPVPNCISEVKPGATLVSVGAFYDGAGVAHSNFSPEAQANAGLYVPPKGGVGPLTRAMLWSNVVACYESNHPEIADQAALRAPNYAQV